MRTTLTLDDELAAALKDLAHERGDSFKTVVNLTLQAGLDAAKMPPRAQKYRIEPARLGNPLRGVDLDRALRLADSLEDEAVAQKLELRK